jgi:hypothetical protein
MRMAGQKPILVSEAREIGPWDAPVHGRTTKSSVHRALVECSTHMAAEAMELAELASANPKRVGRSGGTELSRAISVSSAQSLNSREWKVEFQPATLTLARWRFRSRGPSRIRWLLTRVRCFRGQEVAGVRHKSTPPSRAYRSMAAISSAVNSRWSRAATFCSS